MREGSDCHMGERKVGGYWRERLDVRYCWYLAEIEEGCACYGSEAGGGFPEDSDWGMYDAAPYPAGYIPRTRIT